MTKQEILQNVYNKLKISGAVRSRQDFAEKIGYNYTCTSSALNGVERYLNDRFFTRVMRAFPQVSEHYIRTGEGEIFTVDPETGEVFEGYGTGIQPLTPAKRDDELTRALAAIEAQQELTRRQQEQTEKAIAQIDQLIEIIKTMSGAAIETKEG